MTDVWDDPEPLYRPNWRDRARWARRERAYTPEQATNTLTEAFTHAGLTHYRDQYGQIGHHRPADPKCPCGPTKKETK